MRRIADVIRLAALHTMVRMARTYLRQQKVQPAEQIVVQALPVMERGLQRILERRQFRCASRRNDSSPPLTVTNPLGFCDGFVPAQPAPRSAADKTISRLEIIMSVRLRTNRIMARRWRQHALSLGSRLG
jgi:hypothetical protein